MGTIPGGVPCGGPPPIGGAVYAVALGGGGGPAGGAPAALSGAPQLLQNLLSGWDSVPQREQSIVILLSYGPGGC